MPLVWSTDFLLNFQVTQPMGRPQQVEHDYLSKCVCVCVCSRKVEAGPLTNVSWDFQGNTTGAVFCLCLFCSSGEYFQNTSKLKKIFFNPLYVDILDTFSYVPSKMVMTSVWHYFPLITKLRRRLTKQWLTVPSSIFYAAPAKALHRFCFISLAFGLKFSPCVSTHPWHMPHILCDHLLLVDDSPSERPAGPHFTFCHDWGLGITQVARGRFTAHRV